MWERRTETERQTQTAILTHNFFFSWRYQAVLSSLFHIFCFSPGRHSTESQLWAALFYLQGFASSLPMRRTQSVLAKGLLGPLQLGFSICRWKLALIDLRHRLKLSCGHLHISFYNAHNFRPTRDCFRLRFHRCVLYREYLIEGTVKSQYATRGSIPGRVIPKT